LSNISSSRLCVYVLKPLQILIYFLNFSGHPAASVPAGLTTDNLPVGMQIIGKRYGDADVLTTSGVLERVRPWQQHYAICPQRQLQRQHSRYETPGALGNPYVASVSSCDTTTPAGRKTEVEGLSSLAQSFIF
jgi:hypothetical protein